ncbi:MAG: carbohydrate transporter rane protein 1, family [Actinomycetia bacterium]|nr:carbohydrate transporter rane protein 1, family [Actinomycetes bacterium]
MSRSTAVEAGPGPAATGNPAAAGPLRAPWWRGPKLRKNAELTILLAPALVLFVGFVLIPIVIAAYYSLYNWSGYGPLNDPIGFRNYTYAFNDPAFIQAIEHTLTLTVASLAIQGPLSIGIALLLNRKFFGRAFLRTVVFAPYVLPPAVTAVMWSLILQPAGFADQVLKAFGLGGLVQLWLANVHIVLWTNFVVLTWQYLGFGIVLLLAGLQGVPTELTEAAAIDGASPWQVTRRITLPLLGPTIRIWAFITVIGSLQIFDIVWILTAGGPANASSTITTYMYLEGVNSTDFGFAAAIAVILFAFCFVFALIYQRFALRRDTQGALTRAVG